jgi:hypothetical protein
MSSGMLPQFGAEDSSDDSNALDPLTLKLLELKLSENEVPIQSNPPQDGDNDTHYPNELRAPSPEQLETKLLKLMISPKLPLNSNACDPGVSHTFSSELSGQELSGLPVLPVLPLDSDARIFESNAPVSKLSEAGALPELALSEETCAFPFDTERSLNSLAITLPEPDAYPELASYGYNTSQESHIALLWLRGVMVLMCLFPLILVAALFTSTAFTTSSHHTCSELSNPWWNSLQSERIARLPGPNFRKQLDSRRKGK